MGFQTESTRRITYKKESVFGQLPGTSGGQMLRRIDSTLGLSKSLIRSKERRSDKQRPLARHGQRAVSGGIQGELSPGTYKDFFAAAVCRDWTAVPALSALTTVTASDTAPHFSRPSGSWIADGLRVGQVIRPSGWTTTGVSNNGKNFTIIGLTASGITVAEIVAAKAAGDSVTFSVPGKQTYVPASGHTNDSFMVEDWYPDAGLSQRFVGHRVGAIQLDFPPDEHAQIRIDFMGKNALKDTTAYFINPAAETTSGLLTSNSGAVFIKGVLMGFMTDFSATINRGASGGKVVGANVTPDVFLGDVDVSGNLALYLDSSTYYGYFDDEVPIDIIYRLDADETGSGDFFQLAIASAAIAGGSITTDTEAKLISFEFAAGRGNGSDGWESTTIFMQDSLA